LSENGKSRTWRELAQVLFARWPALVLIIAALTIGTYYACTYATRLYRSNVTLCIACGEKPLDAVAANPEVLAQSDRVLARTYALIAEPELRHRWTEGHRADGAAADRQLHNELDAAAERFLTGTHADRQAFQRFCSRVQSETYSSGAQAGSAVIRISVDAPAPPSNAQLTAETLAQVFADRLCELQEEQPRQATSLVLLDGPCLPDPSRPVWPIRWLFTLVAAAIGLTIATGYAALARRFDHTLSSTCDVERFIALPVLGSVRRRRGGLM
jgi:hypothetical protein